jgi:probable rRNA maturation factor
MVADLRIAMSIEHEAWPKEAELEALATEAFAAAARSIELEGTFDVSLLFANDPAVQTLNRDWRSKDKPTNVLSFPGPDLKQPDGSEHLGDIVLAYETVAKEADEEGKPFHHHVTHLLVHGFLHLTGYDHETDEDAEEMEQLERDILARLAIPDPYAIENV